MKFYKWFKNFVAKFQKEPLFIEKPVQVETPVGPTYAWLADLIVAEATKWVGVREHGYNKGKEVEMFQKAVDGKASGEAWCMAAVQYWCRRVYATLIALGYIAPDRDFPMYGSEHCLTVWNKTPEKYRSKVGGRGMIPIWRHGKTTNGHTGIAKDSGKVSFTTVEGNTNDAGSREGDGVYAKKRLMVGGSMSLVGFIDFPQMLLDCIPADKKMSA